MLVLSEYRSTDTNMIMADVQILANTLMFEHGLLDKGWFFNFDRARKRFGLCDHKAQIISMSKYFTPSRTFEQNKNTILHEIAHALVGPGNGHNAVWKAKAIEIGSDGERCGSIDSDAERPEYRWVAKCPTCGIGEGMHRAPGRVRACIPCGGGVFSFENLVDWYENGELRHVGEMPEKFRNEYYAILRRANGNGQLHGDLVDAYADNGWMDENE
jgi:hypothetical protein